MNSLQSISISHAHSKYRTWIFEHVYSTKTLAETG